MDRHSYSLSRVTVTYQLPHQCCKMWRGGGEQRIGSLMLSWNLTSFTLVNPFPWSLLTLQFFIYLFNKYRLNAHMQPDSVTHWGYNKGQGYRPITEWSHECYEGAIGVPRGGSQPRLAPCIFLPFSCFYVWAFPNLSYTQTEWRLLAKGWSKTRLAMTSRLDGLRKRRFPWRE